MNELLITTQDHLGDYKIIKTFGLVKGNAVRSRNIGRNFIAGLRTIFGGEITEWTKAVSETREHALDRLKKEAIAHGANAVVALRFITSEVGQTASEILAYGTAVLIEKKE